MDGSGQVLSSYRAEENQVQSLSAFAALSSYATAALPAFEPYTEITQRKALPMIEKYAIRIISSRSSSHTNTASPASISLPRMTFSNSLPICSIRKERSLRRMCIIRCRGKCTTPRKKGKLRVDFYNEERNYLEIRTLEGGDVILLASGGHDLKALEELEMIEV